MESKKNPTMKYIFAMLRYRPWLYFLNILLWTGVHVFPLIPGLIVKKFFDVIVTSTSIDKDILSLSAMMIVVILGRALNIEIGGRVDCIHRFNMASILRRNLLEEILKNTGDKNLKVSVGEALNGFRDDAGQIEDTISWTLDLVGEIVFSIVALYILLSINVRITIFVFAPLVLVVGMAQKSRNRIEKYRKSAREATAKVSGAIGEIFNSIQAVKVSGAERNILNNLDALNKNRQKFMLKDNLLVQLMEAIYNNTVNIGTGLILLLAGKYMREGSLTVGEFSLFISYLAYVADCTHFFGIVIARYQQAGVAFNRMSLLLGDTDGDRLVKHNSLHLKGAMPKDYDRKLDSHELKNLEVSNLTYLYDKNSGIRDVNLSVKKGSITVITGRIGSGKTTLLKCLIGIIAKEKGEVYWNGNLVKDNEFFAPPVTSYTAQIPNLFSDTVKNNILLGLKEEDVDLDGAIHAAVLERDIENLDEGLETVIGSKGVKLSGGQMQRVSAARMFIRNPEIMVFDDISSALDIETEIKLWERLFQRENRPTCIMVSNRQVALRNADNIIVMKNGMVEGEGSLEELLENCEEMRQIWGMNEAQEKVV